MQHLRKGIRLQPRPETPPGFAFWREGKIFNLILYITKEYYAILIGLGSHDSIMHATFFFVRIA